VTAVVTLTLPLPEPAPSLLARHARVRTVGHIPGEGQLAELAATSDVLCVQLRDRVTAGVLRAGAGRLKAVCNYAVGYDNVDVDVAAELGVTVTNTPDVLTDATADCAFGLILAAARRLREGDALVRSGRWTGWAPTQLLGLHLGGATLGLVGYGSIAQAVARRATAFGMTVQYTTRRPRSNNEAGTDGPTYVPFDVLLATSDVVSLHVPLSAETHHLLNRQRLWQMKKTAVLVNTSRGLVVDEAALIDALGQGRIASAGLDVFENEPSVSQGLIESDRTALSPHLGSATVVTRALMAEVVATNAIAVLMGEPVPNPVPPRRAAVTQ
jgi:glyoxylate reductase